MAVELNKFLTFNIGEEFYGIPVLNVKEIIGMLDITSVPKMPEYIKGIINLRGKIIPVMDLRIKFGIPSREYDARTCIIVIETEVLNQTRLTGMVVDTVSEVLDINKETIESPLACFGEVNKEYLTGIGKIKDKVIMLLEPINIMSTYEKDTI
ncbi:chemotaxis protein CheW [Clostridium saccharobutylicum]|uniref:Chemotaxis protein CheW n=1 Tax=Clostridium saccharobutylicum DSM 13864 TaxID=1345695 RepID=U5MTL3_CLOSA|nr:chemotaxis protein CheW [Clostridium saccharobutylicum]AGX42991.1 chemotaxis protein CheW [Clostridium saccharobutylicum DSM 13864]AQR90282.1 chemotaxis protein CheW [Clostridium saccharobutylicum]AQS00188.1 chemotaxis protein CheW [Clostridium saccharobutylicum]AQS09987.1 chemotaxis protein CheW [Clostridium saccharobutylicum]AQS14171.1 chemotaxis protein CheW [Clostridium saccharobutylicum]